MAAMLTSDHQETLGELALYTTFLAGALSPIAVPTFCEQEKFGHPFGEIWRRNLDTHRIRREKFGGEIWTPIELEEEKFGHP